MKRRIFQGLISFFVTIMAFSPSPVAAQSDDFPFWFDLIPSQSGKRITYRIDISSRADWRVDDVTISVPIPAGTRFVSADLLPINRVSVANGYITIWLADIYNYADGNSFTLEIINPAQTIFPMTPTVSWRGEYTGNEQINLQSFDTTRISLNWNLAEPRLQLTARATIVGDALTLAIYPKAIDTHYRMWDVGISVPVPAGLTFVSVTAPPPFSAGFDGQRVNFSAIELQRLVNLDPLVINFTLNNPSPTIATKIWAQWTNGPFSPIHSGNFAVKYVDTIAESPPPSTESFALDVIIEQPEIPQISIFDRAGDVPFTNYDLIGVSILQRGKGASIQFRTAESYIDEPVTFSLYIDKDCNSNTGAKVQGLGADYRINISTTANHATIVSWKGGDWNWDTDTKQPIERRGNTLSIPFPYDAASVGQPFCWVASSKNTTAHYFPDPPIDWLPANSSPNIGRYQVTPSLASFAFGNTQGKIAIPLFNSTGFYDTYLFNVLTGNDLTQIPYARQPHLSADGHTLLVNHQHFSTQNRVSYTFWDGRRISFMFKNLNFAEEIFEYNLATKTEIPLSLDEHDAYPFYNPQGTKLVFSTVAPNPTGSPMLAICPASVPNTADKISYQLLASTTEPQGIHGNFPVWLGNDKIAFNPCPLNSTRTDCGIFAVDANSMVGGATLSNTVQLSTFADDIPADADATHIAFTSHRNGNWEVYIMQNDGSLVKNLSNAPTANDGLPAFSPDGKWIAFVSDRDGQWAVWTVPITGGEPQKLFTIFEQHPWGAGDLAWYFERITWSS